MDIIRGSHRGRPIKVDSERRDSEIKIRVTSSEKLLLLRDSYRSGRSLSDWCRRKLMEGYEDA